MVLFSIERNVVANNIAVHALVTKCSVSHDASMEPFCVVECTCLSAMDGDYQTAWATNVATLNEWIQLDFAEDHTVFRVDIYHRCKHSTQCSGLNITFSDGNATSVSKNIITANPIENCRLNFF